MALGKDFTSQFKERLLASIKKAMKKSQVTTHLEMVETAESVLFRIEDESEKFEILFLDIDLPDIDGFETAQRIRKYQAENEIVFIAKNKERVLEAFDVDALHYIVKGETSDEKIEEITRKAIERTSTKLQKVLRFTCAGEVRYVASDAIRYFGTYGRVLRVYYENTFFEFYSTLGKMENTLNGRGFIRIHKSYYVSIRYIKSIVSKEITMMDGTVLPIGKKYYAAVKTAWLDLLNHDSV